MRGFVGLIVAGWLACVASASAAEEVAVKTLDCAFMPDEWIELKQRNSPPSSRSRVDGLYHVWKRITVADQLHAKDRFRITLVDYDGNTTKVTLSGSDVNCVYRPK